MTEQSLVSIGLPTYNRAKWLPRALDALLFQTYQNIELIISDDASSDETEKICREYAQKDNRIRYIRQPKNITQLPNFRFVINEARGKYFMMAADDDFWDPKFIETLYTKLEESPEYGACMSSIAFVREDGSLIREAKFEGKDDIGTFGHYTLFRRANMFAGKIGYYLYGLLRIELARKFMQRPFPSCVRFDHIIVSELTLVERFCSVPETLFRKTIYQTPFATRYVKDPAGKAYQRKRGRRYFKYFYCMFLYTASSPFIPVQRKIVALLFVYPRVVVTSIPMVLYYGFPKTHSFLKRIIRSVFPRKKT